MTESFIDQFNFKRTPHVLILWRIEIKHKRLLGCVLTQHETNSFQNQFFSGD